MLLTGTYSRSIDDKGRFAIPRPLRDLMELSESTKLYLAPGTDQSLAVYSAESFTEMGRRLGDGPPTSQGVRAFSRLFYSQASCVEVDRQGRIRIPPALARMAGFDGELVLVGVRDHLEIWEPSRWQAYLTQMQPAYDEIAERAFGSVEPSETAVVRPKQPR